MAEAFPGNLDKLKPISVLLLATKWQFDTYGLSTVNKSLINNLRVVDPEGKKIKITCAVVDEDKNTREDQRKDAEKYKVELRTGKPPRGAKKKPSIEWLDQNIATYYSDLFRKNSYDFVVGHVPYLGNGPFNFRSNYAATETKPKVILMIHKLPKTTQGDTDEDTLLDWLSDADVVFSLGNTVESEIFSAIKSLDPEQRPIHMLYIPCYPYELFNLRQERIEGNKVRGTQNVTMMTGEQKDLEVSGLDFSLAVTSTAGASEHILEFDNVNTAFVVLTDNEEDKEKWKNEFSELLKKEECKGQSLQFQTDVPETIEKLKAHMRKSNLFILPLKKGSPLFGAETLSAVAAGVPVLVSKNSGMASLLEDASIIKEPKPETWKEGILQKLLKPKDAQREADRLRDELRKNTTIAQTHLNFTMTIVEALCLHLEVELGSDFVVGQELVDRTVEIVIDPNDLGNRIDAKKYVLAFICKLLLQRKNLNLNLQPDIVTLWLEVLSMLENSDRKVVGVQSGSLIFTLFCPTTRSMQELRDDSWISSLTSKMENLVRKIGVGAQLKIHLSAILHQDTQLSSRVREMKVHPKTQSEGYETMTPDSSDIVSEQGEGIPFDPNADPVM